MKILITGANGFIGKAIQSILSEEFSIVAIVRDTKNATIYEGVEYIEHNFTQKLDPGKLPSEIDTIIHLAQSREFRNFPEGMRDMVNINISSTADLLEYARISNTKRFINFSTGSVYSSNPALQTEGSEIRPTSAYPTTKHISEQLTNIYTDFFTAINIRLFFPYGPGQDSMLIPNLIRSVRTGNKVKIQGDTGGLKICPIFVDDVVRVLTQCFNSDISQTINVAGNQTISLLEVVEIIGEAIKKKPIIEVDVTSTPSVFSPSLDRMFTLLGDYHLKTFVDGIQETING